MFKKKPRKTWRLIVEDMNGNLETEVIRIWDFAIYDGMMNVWSKMPGESDSTRTVYNTANFRSLTLEPEDRE